MHERRNLKTMRRLIEVQKVRRAAAEDALVLARQREQDARTEQDKASRESQLAEEQWLDHVSSPGFSPEYGRVLAERLIERDTSATAAAAQASAAADSHARRQRDWQGLEAQVRASEKSSGRMGREVSHREEERRLAALADLVTYRRWRP